MKRLAILALATFAASAAFAQVIPVPIGNRGGVVGTTPEVATLNTGTNLHIAGVAVSPDRRYVGINISLQSAALDGIDTYTGSGTATQPAAAGGGVGGNHFNGLVGNVQFMGTSNLLNARTPAVRGDAMTLREAVKKLSGDAKLNLVLSGNALRNAKVDETAKHKIDVPAGTLAESLTAVLQQTIPDTPMIIRSDSDVVYVTTRAHLDGELVSKSYALDGLVVRLTRFVPAGTDLSVVRPTDAPTASTDTPLTQAVTKHIRPEIWKANGGKSEITQNGNRVIINAPASFHAMIAIPAVKVSEPARPGYIGYGN